MVAEDDVEDADSVDLLVATDVVDEVDTVRGAGGGASVCVSCGAVLGGRGAEFAGDMVPMAVTGRGGWPLDFLARSAAIFSLNADLAPLALLDTDAPNADCDVALDAFGL